MKSRKLTSTLFALGLVSLLPYLGTLYMGSPGEPIISFQFTFFAAFALYGLAVPLVLGYDRPAPFGVMAAIIGFAIAFRIITVFSQPVLSDDMYRYVWDGRVQANGINPYAFPPDAPELQPFRDDVVWPHINRKGSVTVYPAGAQLAFAALWRIIPDNVRWFQIAMSAGSMLAGLLLMSLLRALGRPAHLALIYLWSPLVVFETSQSAHVDGLVLPFLVGAWLTRVKGNDGMTGLLLGAATSLKLYAVMLLPVLWHPRDNDRPLSVRPVMLLTFAATFGLAYVPYLSQGTNVVGYLPQYLGERFNRGPGGIVTTILGQAMDRPEHVVLGLILATLIVIGLIFMLRPAENAERAIRRCVWPIGAYTLLTYNLYPWYMLWLVPLLALFVRPGRLGVRLDAWTGWLMFTGLVALAYMDSAEWAVYAEFLPLYVLLVIPTIYRLVRRSVEEKKDESSVTGDCQASRKG